MILCFRFLVLSLTISQRTSFYACKAERNFIHNNGEHVTQHKQNDGKLIRCPFPVNTAAMDTMGMCIVCTNITKMVGVEKCKQKLFLILLLHCRDFVSMVAPYCHG